MTLRVHSNRTKTGCGGDGTGRERTVLFYGARHLLRIAVSERPSHMDHIRVSLTFDEASWTCPECQQTMKRPLTQYISSKRAEKIVRETAEEHLAGHRAEVK